MSRLACLLLLLAALCAPLAAKDPEWVEVRSPHFILLTDAGANKGREVALRFEQMRYFFGALLQKNQVNTSKPLLILAFRNSKDMRRHAPLWKGKPIELDGLYQQSSDRDFILLDLSGLNAYQTAFHEYAHLLLNSNLPPMPRWFDEGMAEYYSTIRVGKKDFAFGSAPEYAGYVLGENRLMKVADLFNVGADSATYNESGDRRSLFYAQSWLMVHYIIDKKKLAEMNEYCNLVINQKVPVADAIRRAFKMEPAQLDRELNDFYYGNRITLFTMPAPAGLDLKGSYTYQVRPVPAFEVRAELADLDVHSRDYVERGVAELQAIIQQGPDNGPAQRSLGYAYLARGNFAEAGERFRVAAPLLPNDPRVHYYAAALVNARGGAMGGDFATASMRDHLLKAVDLDPDYAEAWDLLGFVYRVDQKYPQAVDAAVKAIKLSPRNDRFRLNLANTYLEARHYDEAEVLLKFLTGSREPMVSSQAAATLARLDQLRNAPVRAGRFSERPRPSSYDDPRWRKPEDDKPAESSDDGAAEPAARAGAAPAPAPKIDQRPIVFLKGKLAGIACEPSGLARITITSGKKTFTFTTPDYKKLVLIGADQFSCAWSRRAVAVNYRESSPTTGDLVSLELQ